MIWRILRLVFIVALTAFCFFAFGADCNRNGVADEEDVKSGSSEDCNGSGIPDECEQDLLRLRQSGEFTELPEFPSTLFAVDLDTDGDLDLVTGNQGPLDFQVAVYLNQVEENGGGRGEFSQLESHPLSSALEAMDHGDLDGDGDIDVAVVTETAALVLWNNGTGSLSASESMRWWLSRATCRLPMWMVTEAWIWWFRTTTGRAPSEHRYFAAQATADSPRISSSWAVGFR